MSTGSQIDNSESEPGLSIYEQRLAWAAQGNFDALFDVILNARRGMIHVGEISNLLHQAIEQRAQDDPEGFADDLHRKMTSFTAFLVCRAQLLMAKILRGHDQSAHQFQTGPSACAEVLALVPHLIELQTHLAGLQQDHAATKRSLELARATRLANDGKQRRKRRRLHPKQRRVSPSPQAPVTPANRLTELMQTLNSRDDADAQSIN